MVQSGLRRFRGEFEGEGEEAFAYMDGISRDVTGFTANTTSADNFLHPELDVNTMANPARRPWQYHLQSAPRRWRRFRSLNVRTFTLLKEGWVAVAVVGTLIGTE